MKLNQILETVIERDAALTPYQVVDLPEAAKARIQNTLVSLGEHLSHEELELLEAWTGGREIFNKAEIECREGECCYYIYPDGSLYFRSTGDSEVWADAADFADEKIINGYDGELDEMDGKLLKHLGGRFEEVVSERGIRK